MKVSATCPWCGNEYIYDNAEREIVTKSCEHLQFVRYDDNRLVEVCYYKTIINNVMTVPVG
jgi:hypothetical protein